MRVRWAGLLAALGLVAGACGSGFFGTPTESEPSANSVPSTTSTTAATTSTTSTTPTTAVAAAPPVPVNPLGQTGPAGLGKGDRGPQVLLLEQRLDALRFDVGVPDIVYDENTAHAVTAFQKLAGLPRSGRATQDVLDRLSVAQPVTPLVPGGGATRVEIDIPRQILLLYQGDVLYRVLPTSTASGKRFCEGGRCRTAVTPPGSFRVEWRYPGWRKSDLGRLYNPLYFNDGIAIHGFSSVPAQPASHGCVRIPMAAARWFPQLVPDGTPVYVVDGRTPVHPLPPA